MPNLVTLLRKKRHSQTKNAFFWKPKQILMKNEQFAPKAFHTYVTMYVTMYIA
jgi:hypothetical protein